MVEVLPVILATAGHVDHGKTALVQALTGCDTDRFPEEKKRGLSIDLGFALCSLDNDYGLGIIDLPGHVDYISNMVAGAALAKIVLLTVAADEGVMPQTEEHLEVIANLTEARIIIVITKTDRVEEKYLPEVAQQVEVILGNYGVRAESICYTSISNAGSISRLRETILGVASEYQQQECKQNFRLLVERTFTVKGYGRVVTGIGLSGCVEVGESFMLNDSRVRVRALESHNRKLTRVAAGVCVALNITETDSNNKITGVKRGWSLFDPESYMLCKSIIVELKSCKQGFTFKKVTKCRIYIATFSCNASVKLFQVSTLESGERCFAQIRLTEPVALSAGDRFILRAPSPYGNIGAGKILGTDGDYRLRQADEYRSALFSQAAKSVGQGDSFFAELLAGKQVIIKKEELSLLSHMSVENALAKIKCYVNNGKLLQLSDKVWVVTLKLSALAERFMKKLRQYHIDNPYSTGMEWQGVAQVFELGLLETKVLVGEFGEGVCISAEFVALREFSPQFTGLADEFCRSIIKALKNDEKCWLAAGQLRDQLGIGRKDSKYVLDYLVSMQKIMVFDDNKFIISRKEYSRLHDLVMKVFEQVDILDIAGWRRVSGLSRNHGVAVLEHFDRLGITRRVDGGRKIVDN